MSIIRRILREAAGKVFANGNPWQIICMLQERTIADCHVADCLLTLVKVKVSSSILEPLPWILWH
jgi:hypothetical protein